MKQMNFIVEGVITDRDLKEAWKRDTLLDFLKKKGLFKRTYAYGDTAIALEFQEKVLSIKQCNGGFKSTVMLQDRVRVHVNLGLVILDRMEDYREKKSELSGPRTLVDRYLIQEALKEITDEEIEKIKQDVIDKIKQFVDIEKIMTPQEAHETKRQFNSDNIGEILGEKLLKK